MAKDGSAMEDVPLDAPPAAAERKPNIFVRGWRGYLRVLERLVAALASLFGKLGGFITRRPLVALALPLALSILLCLGWLTMEQETAGDVLWTPRHSQSKTDRDWVERYYGSTGEYAQVVAEVSASGNALYGTNVLQLETTYQLFQVDKAVRSISVKDKSGRNVTYAELCYKGPSGKCQNQGYLNFWNSSFEFYALSVGATAGQPKSGNLTKLMADINQPLYPDGTKVIFPTVFGGVSMAGEPTRITAARAISISYPLDASTDDAVLDDWYDAFEDLMESTKASSAAITLAYIDANSMDDEITRSVNDNLYLIAISVAVYVVVAVIVLSRFNLVSTHTSLGLIGIFSAVIGLAAGYGVASLFGAKFTILAQTLPFVVLGIAIDLIFILVKTMYDVRREMPPTASLRLHFRGLMATSGLSVFVTNLASIVAFALGALSELPSITWFAGFASLSLMCVLFMQLTFFISAYYLTERRILAERFDFLCCLGRRKGDRRVADANGLGGSTPVGSMASQSYPAYVEREEEREGLLRIFIRKYYAPFLMHNVTRAVVVLAFVGFFAFSCWAVDNLKRGQPLSDLAPDDSYLQSYISINKATFEQDAGGTTGLFFRGMDFSQPSVQAQMCRALDQSLRSQYINVSLSAFQPNILLDFIDFVQTGYPNVTLTADGCYNPYLNSSAFLSSPLRDLVVQPRITGCVPAAAYVPLMTAFLAANDGYLNLLVEEPWLDNATVPLAKRLTSRVMPLTHTAPHPNGEDNSRYDINVLNSVQDVSEKVNEEVFASRTSPQADVEEPSDYVFLIYMGDYIFAEGSRDLTVATIEFIALGSVGVALVLLVMLVHPLASAIMLASVFFVCMYLFGWMYMLNIRFNDVSAVNIVLATGLAIDYSVYLAQSFMTTESDRRTERAAVSLTKTGSALLLGGVTALLGVVPMAFSSSVILRTFFKLIFGTLLFALLVGLVFIPVVFSLIGPAPVHGIAYQRVLQRVVEDWEADQPAPPALGVASETQLAAAPKLTEP